MILLKENVGSLISDRKILNDGIFFEKVLFQYVWIILFFLFGIWTIRIYIE